MLLEKMFCVFTRLFGPRCFFLPDFRCRGGFLCMAGYISAAERCLKVRGMLLILLRSLRSMVPTHCVFIYCTKFRHSQTGIMLPSVLLRSTMACWLKESAMC